MDIFEFVGISQNDDDPIGDFLSKVANGALLVLTLLRQSGVHCGQSLYAHLLNIVLTVDLVAQLLGCNNLERRLLICAAVLHDLNKLDPQHRPISKVATTEDVSLFLKHYKLDQILPDMETAVEIVRRLIAAHSGHLHQGADSLLPLTGPVSRDRLRNILIPILQLADQADVARKFSDHRKREQVLSSLNAASNQQYRWEWHRLSEYRGPFSNLIHNAVIAEMEAQLGAKPFLHYGEGTFYLVPSSAPATLQGNTYSQIAIRLSKTVKRLKGGNAADFVAGSPTGIKINPEIFTTGLSLRDAFNAAAKMILARQFKGEKISEMEQKARGRAKDGYKTLFDSNGNLFPHDQELMRMGELLRVIYNFLQAHCSSAFKGKNKKFENAWHPIYHKLQLEIKPEWLLVDALNDRAYVVARNIKVDFSIVLDQIIELAEEFAQVYSLRNGEDTNPTFTDYIQSILNISCLLPAPATFIKHLEIYSDPSVVACSLCSMPMPADVMMTDDVPKGLVVAQFSNRNLAGKGDPKRNSCPICREQLLVERIGFAPAPAQNKGLYLHIFPESFAPPIFISALRRIFQTLQGLDIRTILFDTRTISREYETSKILRLNFKLKSIGLALPLYPELIGNVITLPIYPAGDNDTERYLFALQYALFIHQRFGQRVVLSQSIIPTVTTEEMQESNGDNGIKIYFDGLPGVLRGLLPRNALTGSGTDNVFELLQALKIVADKIGSGEDLIDLVRSLNDGELGVFFAAHRAIERNSKSDQAANTTAGEIAHKLKYIAETVFHSLKGERGMNDVSVTNILEQMAEVAWQKSIRGATLAHTSLIKPIDIAFQLLRRQGNREVSFLKLVSMEEILRHIERTSEYGVGQERNEAIETWTILFFDELLVKGFHADIRRLIRDEKLVKAAYTTLLRQQLRKASEAKKQASSEKK
ncbi:MAG: type I-D CRISPR-associated protein Cas10d/Csc3 [Acidobacteriota bacterium]